jgi:hypothetical protein
MWSAPRTWVTGELVTGAIMNNDVRDQFRYVGGPDSRGAALPGAPVDGQLFIYTVDAGAGIEWLLKYEQATAKWRFLGGPPLISIVDASEATSSTTYTTLTTAGPSVIVPLLGDYAIEIGSIVHPSENDNTTESAYHSFAVGAVGAVDADAVEMNRMVVTGGAPWASVSTLRRKTGVAAGTTVASRYRSSHSACTARFRKRWMRVTPLRIG